MKMTSRLREATVHAESGADGQNSTDDLLITNQLLYQLSYVGLLLDCIVALE